MGDRTTCFLTIATADESRAEHFIHEYSDPDEKEHYGDHTEYCFEEVNYGEMDEQCKDALIAAGIPFDWSCGTGNEYDAETSHFRYTNDGNLMVLHRLLNNTDTGVEATDVLALLRAGKLHTLRRHAYYPTV